MLKEWDKKKVKDFIINDATEQDLVDIIEIMRAKRNIIKLEEIAKQKEKIIKDVERLF